EVGSGWGLGGNSPPHRPSARPRGNLCGRDGIGLPEQRGEDMDVLVTRAADSERPAARPSGRPAEPASPARARASSAARLARRLGLHLVKAEELAIRRRRYGKGYAFYMPDGTRIRDPDVVRRLNALAVPPAYTDVLCAEDPAAHLQAVGRDAAGRLQYRYHPEWEKVREARKAHRMASLVQALPRIRRSIGAHLAGDEPTREFALAAVIDLVARSAIRSGSESYARERGTRGAAT